MLRAMLRAAILVALTLALTSLPVTVRPALAEPDPPLSPRNANYTIKAQLDPATHTVEGRLVLTWINLQDRPTDELPFHLYWNAWRNDQSTWMIEDARSGGSGPVVEREDWSWMQVHSARQVEPPEVDRRGDAGVETPTELGDVLKVSGEELPLRYVVPADGHADDRTVLVVDLPRAVEPGENIAVELRWSARVPRTFARTGRLGDYYFLAHWFPKLGVFEPEGWHCPPFRALTEFYSDYGVYDVALTVPSDFVVGATGREVEILDLGDGTTTHRYAEEDVHGFAWTASPDYIVRERRFEVEGLPPVDMRLLLQPEHLSQADRHFDATAAALEHYGRWYGPYPYGHVTIIDPVWRSGAGGMEYPTFFTAGTRLSNPFGGGSPEGVTIHEAGHQFWYGMVGNNEFDFAWLDEGINTFSTARTYAEAYGERQWKVGYLDPPGTDFGAFIDVLFPDVRQSRAVYGNRFHRFLAAGAATAGPLSDPTWSYYPPTAGRLSYDKASLGLATLERHLGWETLRNILSTFFKRWRFGHPRPEDFYAVAEEVSGRDLESFFDQVWKSSVSFDYAVASVDSVPVGTTGWVAGNPEGGSVEGELSYVEAASGDGGTSFRTEVVVRRLGEGVFPVDVLLVFEDGREVRHAWDGQERWKVFVEEGPSKIDHAAVDPERVLLLDLDSRNNSRLRRSEAKVAARRWSARWMLRLQEFLHTFSFFI